MRWLALVLVVLPACRCGNANIAGRYGDLVIVQQDVTTGRELQLKNASLRALPVFMGEVGETPVPVRNVGLESITIDSVTRLEGDEALSMDSVVGRSITPDLDDTLPVQFTAPQARDATAPSTEHRAKFSLKLSGARAGDDELIIELTATAEARDCFVPKELDFGAVPLRHAVTLPLRLTNGSSADAVTQLSAVEGVDLPAFSTQPGAGGVPVAAHATATVNVRFEPLEARDYSATVRVKRSAACPEATTTLKGHGDDAALAWTPTRIDFGKVPLQLTAVREVTFTNGTNADLSLSAMVSGGGFVLPAGTPTVLPAKGTVVVEVACAPQVLGPLAGTLRVDLGTEPLTNAAIALTCSGGGPRIRVDPNPLSLGQVPLNETTRRRLIVQNVGTMPAPNDTSMNLLLGQPGGALPWFAIVPKNRDTSPMEFGLGLRTAYDANTGLPALAGQNLVEFELTITPTGSAALREADLLVYSNDAVEPVVRVPLTALPRQRESCRIRIEPPSFDFGRAAPGTGLSKLVQVFNDAPTGSVCLLSGVEMAPGSNLAFQLVEPATGSAIILGGQSKPIIVSAVVDATVPEGTFLRGEVRFHASGESADRTLPTSLLVSPCLVADPPLVNVGLVQVGCRSASRAVNLYNVCGVPIPVTVPGTMPPPFNLTSAPVSTTIPAGGVMTLQINAAPTQAGAFSGVFPLTSNAQTLEVGLQGNADAQGQQSDSFSQTVSQTDILLVVDDSGSMADKQARLATNFAAFIAAASGSQADWHIGVTTTDPSEQGVLRRSSGNPPVLTPTIPNVQQLWADKVKVGTGGSGWERPFDSMELALSQANLAGANAGFLRANAMLAVVIVSDAQDQSMNDASSYLSVLRQAKGGRRDLVQVSVVGPFFGSTPTCTTEVLDMTGRYTALINATGGVMANICTQNWADALRTVSDGVFSTRRSFELTGSARGASDITVTVDGQVVTAWTFDATKNQVVLASAPVAGSTIVITYRTACF